MVPAQNPFAPPTAAVDDPAKDAAKKDAGWALIFGIISIFFCAPLFSTLAIIYARRAQAKAPEGMASIAIVLAVIGAVLCLVIGIAVIGFGAIWQSLAPPPR